MLELTSEQWDEFQKAEFEEYLENIEKRILSEHSDMVPDREGVSVRLRQAHDYLIQLAFRDEALICSFLYMVAFNPGFQDEQKIRSVLEMPGRTPERQYKDLLYVLKNLAGREI